MSMPDSLILIRHGESEGNIAQAAAWAGDLSKFTDEYVTTPGRKWRLTDRGQEQAALIGSWVRQQLLLGVPSRGYVSPYVRTRETAGLLGIDSQWYLNRANRERDWDDIETIPKASFADDPAYALNARKRLIDPMYWRPPGGESISDVADNRVRNFLDTLHREVNGQVIAVTHGEFIRAARIVLERISDEQYEAWEADPAAKIANCEAFHYSCIDPVSGRRAPRLTWLRRAKPIVDGNLSGSVEVGGWERIDFERPSSAELLNGLG